MSVEMEKTSQLTAATAQVMVQLPRVNLMPHEVTAESKLRRMQLILGGVTVAVAAGIAGVAVLCFMGVSNAQDDLAVSQARTSTLRVEEAKYAAVPKMLSEIDTLKNARAQAMSTDVAWYQQLDLVNQEFPANMKFKTLTVSLNAAGAAPGSNPLATPNTIGTLTVEGYGPNYLNTADWMDALTGHPGFVDPYYSQATLAEATDSSNSTIVQVSSTVQLTSDVLTHRFDRKAE